MSVAIRKDQFGKVVEYKVDGVPQPLNEAPEIPVDTPELKAVDIDKWPLWAKALKQFSTPEDKGIGDVVARIIGAETSEKFKAWHLVTFGRPCGCTGREKLWNTKYPLTSPAT